MEYWTVSQGVAVRNGHMCRECKSYIFKGSSVIVRDGRKIRLFYHPQCFSGEADPRTQTHSSFQKFKGVTSEKAPLEKGRGKWSTTYGYNDAAGGLTGGPLQNHTEKAGRETSKTVFTVSSTSPT
uniref:PARP-type domain-containing protein n=1 Tax=Chromera velia CCMP2878 TaxID=1169474 RepID=A0A0G4GTW4_9ALVE|mmetsp:Transcript_49385/g.97306  ORF Transcript_49385/g.97306 Transcript_49385/m.97306 type:complete len:125 (-) Transcript_49385:164-538(-)|eukprot:Cvel_5188.t1-p1 / transcript=Cvel_5188.t1 / gene=Cvel_5188 / organism=Chromera_velia_CCMP2878 / gene_product=hypothetical protein / transcript_product=hypothetical protein / location=Cvel_scaffold238:77013-79272(-) / protein_length=124 / sequence_SO=supercontig / SO=protein_coding / is_pseudo=false